MSNVTSTPVAEMQQPFDSLEEMGSATQQMLDAEIQKMESSTLGNLPDLGLEMTQLGQPAPGTPIPTEISEKSIMYLKFSTVLDEYNEIYNNFHDKDLSQFQRNFIRAFILGTDHMKHAKMVNRTVRQFKEDNKYTHNSVSKLIVVLRHFIKWVQRHRSRIIKVNFKTITDESDQYEDRNKVNKQKETPKRKKERFDGLPSFEEMALLAKKRRRKNSTERLR